MSCWIRFSSEQLLKEHTNNSERRAYSNDSQWCPQDDNFETLQPETKLFLANGTLRGWKTISIHHCIEGCSEIFQINMEKKIETVYFHVAFDVSSVMLNELTEYDEKFTGIL